MTRSGASPSSTNSSAARSLASSSCDTYASSRFVGISKRPRFGRELAAHQREEARLAAAVLSRDADFLAAEQAEGGAGEEQPRAAADRDVGEIEAWGRQVVAGVRA